LLGVSVEKEGIKMIAVAPKCYYITGPNEKNLILKIKGVSLARNRISPKDCEETIDESKIIRGQNCGFHTKKVDGSVGMVKLETDKNAITPVHNKMICLKNNSCAPFIEGLTRKDYICE
jgi:hypothetical protein